MTIRDDERLLMSEPSLLTYSIVDRTIVLAPELSKLPEGERYEYACVLLAWSDAEAADDILEALRQETMELSPQSISSIRLAASAR